MITMSSLRKPLGLLIDLSGTIHIEDQAIKGSIEAVNLLRRQKVPFLFVTNTTKESQQRLCSRLKAIGFNIDTSEVFSSLTAAHQLIKGRNLRPLLMLSESALEDFYDTPQEDPNAVVIGLAPEKFNYENMSLAFRLIKEQGAPLIAIHKARYMMTKSGLAVGPGCFVSGLEYSADVKAEVVGKPEASFFSSALSTLNMKFDTQLGLQDLCMIGDDVRDDVLGAINCGMMGCLVKTGKFTSKDEEYATNALTFDSFPQAVNYWFGG